MSKTIVITGGGRGIGAATARLAGARGWSVGLSYLSNDKAAQETVAAVEAAGGKAFAVKGDVAKEEDVLRLFDTAAERFGPISVSSTMPAWFSDRPARSPIFRPSG